jgi:catalase
LGKKTEVFARFSGIFTEQGDPDTSRDPRGFALKFYTEEGNWDLLTINTPVFAVRDAKPGPDQVHAFKRDPRNGEWNPDQTWDFVCNHPEGLLQTLMLYTDLYGTPMSYRFMDTYGCNTYSFINAEAVRHWVKFHLISVQGRLGLSAEKAALIAGQDPNWLSRDLRDAIGSSQFPRWKLCVQIMPEDEGYSVPFAFDCTKVWPIDKYPLTEIGTIEMNANPQNYFAEVEQVALSPSNVIPGIGFSPDKLLQGRLFMYDDTQAHRLGPNFKQLPVNLPMRAKVHNQYYGASGQYESASKFPQYAGSSYGPQVMSSPIVAEPPLKVAGPVGFYDLPGEGTEQDFFGLPRKFWSDMSSTDKDSISSNISLSLLKVSDVTKANVLALLEKVDIAFKDSVDRKVASLRSGTGSGITVAQKIWMDARQALGLPAQFSSMSSPA